MQVAITIRKLARLKMKLKQHKPLLQLMNDDKCRARVDNIVLVEGVCSHICSHGGKKLFLMGDDDSNTIRVEANDDIGAFKPECETV